MTLFDLAQEFNKNPESNKEFFDNANSIILASNSQENKDNKNSFEYIRYNLVDTGEMSLSKYGVFHKLFNAARDLKASEQPGYYDEL